jgi:K+/H+ antiporter YhaU regulatory subunit KhtT
MVAELKEVISKVEQLDNKEQKQIAKLLEDEMKWESTLKNTQSQLGNLAQEALSENKAGKTRQGDW